MKGHLHNSLRALFLSLAVLLSLPMLAEQVMIDGINYELVAKAKQATVIYKSGEYSGEVVIPESVEYQGTTYSVTSIGEDAFVACFDLTSVTIPNSVTSIGSGAFYQCGYLTSVTIPNSVTSIGRYAFWECFRLTSVTIPNSVTSIGSGAFYDCDGLTSVTIGSGVTSIGENTFFDCDRLTSVTIGNSVKSIGKYAFYHCFRLTSVTIPYSVTSIGSYAFYGCKGLTSVTIPNSVKSIGSDAFYGCSGLTSVTIPNSVTSIGGWAFMNCSGLTSVTIGSGVTSIGWQAFANCPELLDVYCYAENVPSTKSNAFDGSYPEYVTLHVPAASKSAYKTTTPWSGFITIKALPQQAMTIVDGELFDNDEERTLSTLTYTRTLPNLKWNALYVPFEIPVAEIAEKYEVAYINDINSYDKNDDGAIDDMEMEIIKIKSGTLNANYPYLIKARNEEARNMSITLENATLYLTVSTTIDCSSVFAKHEVTGIYDRKYQNELPEGCMAISVNGAWQPIATGSYLNPFRLYMTVSARDGSPVKVELAALSRIRISVLGEDDMETGIEDVKTENGEHKTVILDLSGRRVQNPEKGGVYIVNGKKVVY